MKFYRKVLKKVLIFISLLCFFFNYQILCHTESHSLVTWLAVNAEGHILRCGHSVYLRGPEIFIHHLRCACITWDVHISPEMCIHHLICAYITWDVHTSPEMCIHHLRFAYIPWYVHTSPDICIHHLWCSYITWDVHTSPGMCIHHLWCAYITWECIHHLWCAYITCDVHTSPVMCIHYLWCAYITSLKHERKRKHCLYNRTREDNIEMDVISNVRGVDRRVLLGFLLIEKLNLVS
jgi:hypothetical protein